MNHDYQTGYTDACFDMIEVLHGFIRSGFPIIETDKIKDEVINLQEAIYNE